MGHPGRQPGDCGADVAAAVAAHRPGEMPAAWVAIVAAAAAADDGYAADVAGDYPWLTGAVAAATDVAAADADVAAAEADAGAGADAGGDDVAVAVVSGFASLLRGRRFEHASYELYVYFS